MKNPTVIARERIHAAREWIFHHRGLDGMSVRGLLALGITACAFAAFAATVRIRVAAPRQWVERKASIIQLPPDGDGKIWAIRAQEGGPFPSPVDLSEWEKTAGPGDPMLLATRVAAPGYQPKLRDLPAARPIPPLAGAPAGERVFPKYPAKTSLPSPPSKLVPELYALSGISMEELPAQLPAFDGAVDALASVGWRFLVRLRADGGVSEVISFTDDAGGNALADWLRGLNFTPAVARKSPWIGLGLGFANPAAHGPESR